jgi:hypothetical protein
MSDMIVKDIPDKINGINDVLQPVGEDIEQAFKLANQTILSTVEERIKTFVSERWT